MPPNIEEQKDFTNSIEQLEHKDNIGSQKPEKTFKSVQLILNSHVPPKELSEEEKWNTPHFEIKKAKDAKEERMERKIAIAERKLQARERNDSSYQQFSEWPDVNSTFDPTVIKAETIYDMDEEKLSQIPKFQDQFMRYPHQNYCQLPQPHQPHHQTQFQQFQRQLLERRIPMAPSHHTFPLRQLTLKSHQRSPLIETEEMKMNPSKFKAQTESITESKDQTQPSCQQKDNNNNSTNDIDSQKNTSTMEKKTKRTWECQIAGCGKVLMDAESLADHCALHAFILERYVTQTDQVFKRSKSF